MTNEERAKEFIEILKGLWDKELPNMLFIPAEQSIVNLLNNLDSHQDYSLFTFPSSIFEDYICDIKTISCRPNGPKGLNQQCTTPIKQWLITTNGGRQFFLYIAFAYNLCEFSGSFFVSHYLNFKHYENSLSPIFVNDGFQVEYDFYGNPTENYSMVFLVNRHAFNYVKERTNDIESSYLYSLHIDLSNFYSNIYTHHLERLGDRYNTFGTKDILAIKEFFTFLDVYSQKCNLSQTKGLIPGPFSSTVAAELLMCQIDKAINERILVNQKIGYVRNVDDMTLFADSKETLEKVFNSIQILLSDYQLPINDSKTKIEHCAFEFQEDMLEEVHSITNNLIAGIDSVDALENFKASLAKTIKSGKTSVARGILTSLKTGLAKKDDCPQKPVRLICFFLKLALTEKWLGSRCMQIIDVLLEKSDPENRQTSLAELQNKLPIINDSCNDSVIQIWAYYLIGVYADDNDRDIAFNDYVSREAPKNPIVLSTFVKSGYGNNKKLFKCIREEAGFANKNLFYTKFPPTVLKLYAVDKYNYHGYQNNLPNIVTDLFT